MRRNGIIAPEDRRALAEFGRAWYGRVTAEQTGGPLVYHYTGPTALLGILGETTLRATNIAFLNDATEYYLSIDRIAQALDRLCGQSDAARPLVEGMRRRFAEVTEKVPPVYVVSFSRQPDLLSQWRGYGETECGFSIGFDIDRLAALLPEGAFLCPCIYSPESNEAFAADLVRTVFDLYRHRQVRQGADEPAAERLIDGAFDQLTTFAALFKHEGFQEEQEWRVVCRLEPGEEERLRFFARTTCIATYLPLSFEADPGLVREIWVGPSRHQHLSDQAIRALLTQKGFAADIHIQRSTVPFRLV